MTSSALHENDELRTVDWVGDAETGFLRLIDQTKLPMTYETLSCRDLDTVWEAIKVLRVRGAPAIGVAAAFGAVIGARALGLADLGTVRKALKEAGRHLRTSRPTAVNLFWALDRMDRAAALYQGESGRELVDRLLAEAAAICEEDRAMCREIGRQGAELIAPGQTVLTHCNAGGLATADYGTALAVIFTAHGVAPALKAMAHRRGLTTGAAQSRRRAGGLRACCATDPCPRDLPRRAGSRSRLPGIARIRGRAPGGILCPAGP